MRLIGDLAKYRLYGNNILYYSFGFNEHIFLLSNLLSFFNDFSLWTYILARQGNMIRQDVTLIKEMRRQHFEHEKRVEKEA